MLTFSHNANNWTTELSFEEICDTLEVQSTIKGSFNEESVSFFMSLHQMRLLRDLLNSIIDKDK